VRRAGGAKESGQRPRKGEQCDGVEHKEGAVGRGRREWKARSGEPQECCQDGRQDGRRMTNCSSILQFLIYVWHCTGGKVRRSVRGVGTGCISCTC
jgi:hypothetical protein